MKAVLVHVSDEELALRHRQGLDRHDEMWDGVLHMVPAPDTEHQRILLDFASFLKSLLARTRRGTVLLEVNVHATRTSEANYRIPDLSFVASGHEAAIARDGVRGGPDAVVEIRSPEDETYEKFPFFASIGVREVLVIHRDSREAEIHRLADAGYRRVPQDPDGSLLSETLRVRFRRSGQKLVVEDLDDPSLRVEI